jgi:CubicO group peptidase (beta-lactamase class C family)
MDRRDFMLCAAGAAVSLAVPVSAGEPRVKDLGEQLEAIRKQYELPGLAAAAVRGPRIVAEGAAGVRRVGKRDKLTPNDRLALASCTKRMTSAMVARVIDTGKLTFETTLAEALPEIAMRDDYRKVTVAQLLTHTGGIQSYTKFTPQSGRFLMELKGSAAEQREQFIKHLLQEEPVAKPGTQRIYSNASYALVAFVAERRAERSWETLMQDEVFKPLGMSTAGFGRPVSQEHPNEPTLHRKGGQGYEPEPEGQPNVMAVLAPAGDVHCSIRDFAKFAAYELEAAQGRDSLLKPATAKRWQDFLRTQPIEGRSFFGGSPFVSSGFIIWRSINLAVAVAANAGGGGDAVRAVFDAIKQREAEFEK